MQVLADLVGDGQVLRDGRRVVRCKYAEAFCWCGNLRQCDWTQHERLVTLGKKNLRVIGNAMTRIGLAGDLDAARLQHFCQRLRSILGRVFEGESHVVAIGRQRSIESHSQRTWFAIKPGMRGRACGRKRGCIVEGIVAGRRVPD